jgi:membrane fusion protein, multidrug efflux system
LLRQGETGNIILTNTLKDALVIPQKATFEVLDKKFVYVVDKENRLQSRQIVLREEIPHLFVVASGLEETDTILLEGLSKVKLHDKINPNPQKKSEVLAGLNLSVK